MIVEEELALYQAPKVCLQATVKKTNLHSWQMHLNLIWLYSDGRTAVQGKIILYLKEWVMVEVSLPYKHYKFQDRTYLSRITQWHTLPTTTTDSGSWATVTSNSGQVTGVPGNSWQASFSVVHLHGYIGMKYAKIVKQPAACLKLC